LAPLKPPARYAGHQPQHVGQLARAGAADGVAIDDRYRAGRVAQRLSETAHRQDDGQLAEVILLREFGRQPAA